VGNFIRFDMFAKHKKFKSDVLGKIFAEMLEKNVVSWSELDSICL
jgi:hypothetical protein